MIPIRCTTYNGWQYPCNPILFDVRESRCSSFSRSLPMCSDNAYIQPRQQLNGITAFVDGSHIYGDNLFVCHNLRSSIGQLRKSIVNPNRSLILNIYTF